MKPNNFKQSSRELDRHFYNIIFSLVTDEAVKSGLITKEESNTVLIFFLRAWMNDTIRLWLTSRTAGSLKENRLVSMIAWVHEKRLLSWSMRKKELCEFLLRQGKLRSTTNLPTMQYWMTLALPPYVESLLDAEFFKISKMPS